MKKLLLILCLIVSGCTTFKADREKYVSQHPDIKEETKKDIIQGLVSIGMSKDQVRASWGPPSRQGESITTFAHLEHWVYYDSYVIYFENDKVSSIDKLAY